MSTVDRNREGLRMRAAAVRILAWLLLFAAAMQLLGTGYMVFVWDPSEIVVSAPGTDAGTPPHVIASMVAGFAAILFYAVVLIFFVATLVWIHKAHSNLADAGVRMDHSANWAVGSWFIPVANLVVPHRATRELWNRSHGEEDDLAHVGAEEVSAWWTSLLIGVILMGILGFKFAVNMLTNLIIYAPAWAEYVISAFALLLLVAAALQFSKLAGAITRAQESSRHVANVFE